MGPPHPKWQHKTAVFRHVGHKPPEMLTQCVEKAPKWSFTGRPKDLADQPAAVTSAGPIAVNDSHKYSRDPVYSFGPAGGPDGDNGQPRGLSRGVGRGFSAPPGPANIPLGPTTPQFSFGTTKRGSPFPDGGDKSIGPGPSAFSDPRYTKGPRFSMEARRSHSRPHDGPGPGGYLPKYPGGATFAPHWGKPHGGRSSRGLDDPGNGTGGDLGGGGLYNTFGKSGGPSYSIGARRNLEISILDSCSGRDQGRELGLKFTHFGYNDFGRASH